MLNVVAIMGRLVRDPEIKTTQSGINVCSFCIACDRNHAKDGNRQADFISCVAWRNTADFVQRYFSKGSLIAIEGSLQTRQYEDKNGNKRTAVEVLANNVSFAGSKSDSHQQAEGCNSNSEPAQPPVNDSDFTLIEDDGDLPF